MERVQIMALSEIWVPENPEKGRWYASREEIDKLCIRWNVEATPTDETRDQGYGQERLYIFRGELVDLSWFKAELIEGVYYINKEARQRKTGRKKERSGLC